MPSPSAALTSLRPDLGTLMEFDPLADLSGAIGMQVLPVLESAVQAGTFGKVKVEDLLRGHNVDRAPGAPYARDTRQFEDVSFACKEHGLEGVVDDREARMYAQYFDAELFVAQVTMADVLREAEKRIAALIFNATTWTGAALTTAITHEWDDATNAVPITDVNAAKNKVYDGTGLWPNALIVNRKVFHNLRTVASIIDAIESSGAGFPARAQDVTIAQLAAVFDLNYILVGGGSKNTAIEGQDASLSQIWSDEYAMVAKIAVSPNFREPCLGRTIHWGEDGSMIGGTIETYGENRVRGQVVRVRHDTDEKVLYTGCGHLLSNVTT